MSEEIKLNSNHVNAAITAHILSEEEMREIGFTDYAKNRWYYCRGVGEGISFNVTIPKDGNDISIDVLDEGWLQPYDYQHILRNRPSHAFALKVQENVEKQMEYLQGKGVLSGHVRGSYI